MSTPPTAPRFPLLREDFADDPKALIQFSQVLQRELRRAADELDKALERNNATAVGDLKHKLKTTLHLIEADRLATNLAALTEQLRAGEPASTAQRQSITQELREHATALEEESW